MLSKIRTKINEYLVLYRSISRVYSIFYVCILFLLIFLIILGYQLNYTDCNLLICDYKQYVGPVIGILEVVLLLPSVLLIFLPNLNFITALLLLILTLSWLVFFLPYILTLLYCRVKKVPIINLDNFSEKGKLDSIIDLSYVLLLTGFVISTFLTFFLYPKTYLDIDILEYVRISSFIGSLSTFFMNFIREEKMDSEYYYKLRSIYFMNLFYLLIGFFATFVEFVNINESDKITLAFLNGIQVGSIQSPMLSILVIIFIFITYIKNKKEGKI